ncbi:MAG: creatininase family protein [Candidatus Latescibacteria bacterium]|nr:creatininase family protein [Candidatus Latescibacterota bacterium]
MRDKRVFIGDLTRKEFREMIENGTIKATIVPTAATEQHLEHLEMIHDTASVTYMAHQAALTLYPSVVVATPIPIGVSEHWMAHKGTLTVRKEVFTEYVYDVCDALKRGGVKTILILNGHGGNVRPMMERMEEYRQKLGINVRFNSYWDVYPPEVVYRYMEAGSLPGHADEFETSMALALFPERVHAGDMEQESTAKLGTVEKGQGLIQPAVDGVVDILKKMIAGVEVDLEPRSFGPTGARSMVRDAMIQKR